MGGIYRRGKRLWRWFFDVDGTRVFQSTGLEVGQEARAREVLREIERQVAARGQGRSARAGPCIYLARMEPVARPQRIKAGFSVDVARRLRTYLTASPEAQLIAVEPAGPPAEGELKRRLEKIGVKVRSEVFDIDLDRAVQCITEVAAWWKVTCTRPP